MSPRLHRWARRARGAALAVDGRWASSFVGPVALPGAINHDGRFDQQLAAKLFADPEFLQAVK